MRVGGAALLACFWLSSAQGHPALDRAQDLKLSGHPTQAQNLLDSLLATEVLREDSRAEATYLRALLSEDADEMERYLRGYLQEPGSPPLQAGGAELRLGRLAYARRQMEDALLHFDRAMEFGLTEEGSLWKGLAASALGQRGLAQESLSRAASSGSTRIRQRALMALGDLERRSRDLAKAIDYYETLREETPSGPGWWSAASFHLADCRDQQGKPEEAQIMYRELVELAPQAYEAPLSRQRFKYQRVENVPAVEIPEEIQRYSVQMGAFTVKEHAQVLADSLQVLGFPVEILSGDSIHRVTVGQFATREAAAVMGDSLDVHFGTGYQIIEPDGF